MTSHAPCMPKTHADYHFLAPIEAHNCQEHVQIREEKLMNRERRFQKVIYANIALFIFSAVFWLAPSLSGPSDIQCAKKNSPYSPVWEAVEFLEGDFVNFFNHTSQYRGPPTLEREAAWSTLWEHPGVGIDRDGIAALNKSKPGKEFAQIQGSDPENPTYAATLEVFHQLHCLNVIRQATWPLELFQKSWGYLYPVGMENTLANRMHVDHCIETLRLSLMCYGDITPVLAEIAEHRKVGLMLDFNIHHKCRDYSKIVQYVERHGVDIPPLQDPEAI